MENEKAQEDKEDGEAEEDISELLLLRFDIVALY